MGKIKFLLVAIIIAAAGAAWWFYLPKAEVAPPAARRLGVLLASDLQTATVDGIKDGLKELGYVEGKDYLLDVKNPKGDRELTKTYAKELVASKPSLLIPVSTTASSAIKEANATATLPVVFVDVGSLESLGITNLQRPGGTMTGVVVDNVLVSSKRMELLKELNPSLTNVGVLLNSKHVSYKTIKSVHDESAKSLGLEVKYYDITKADELPGMLAKIAKEKPQAIMTTTDANLSGNADIIAKALKDAKIPSIDFNSERGIKSGYLMVYGVTRYDTGKQGSLMIDRVLRGQAPGEIPIEFAGVPVLELNAATAKVINVTFPNSLLLQAETILDQ
ncbi:ABC transporter substrate-binding protein [Candidatus Giovannonibacteria bacterium]|nr:ABC transporter substrate-binding protein [Candidatus Giovannonibacteria bacterium]